MRQQRSTNQHFQMHLVDPFSSFICLEAMLGRACKRLRLVSFKRAPHLGQRFEEKAMPVIRTTNNVDCFFSQTAAGFVSHQARILLGGSRLGLKLAW